MSLYCENPGTHKNRNINKCQLSSSGIFSDSLSTPKKSCSESHTEVGKVNFSGHIWGSYSEKSFLEWCHVCGSWRSLTSSSFEPPLGSTQLFQWRWQRDGLFNHWDGYFYHSWMNQGSQVIPRPLLDNLYMTPTLGQLCSLVCTRFVLFSPHNNTLGYMPWIISILQIRQLRHREMKESTWGSSSQICSLWWPETLRMGTQYQNHLRNNTKMLFCLFFPTVLTFN